jgi:plastocyanin
MQARRVLATVLALVLVAGCDSGEAGAPPTPGERLPTLEAPVPAGHDRSLIPMPDPPGENRVGVRLSEYKIEMTKTRVPAGEVEFHVVNAGTTIHLLVVRNVEFYDLTPHLPPGDSAVLRVALTPGTYQYLCTVRDEFDHYSEGMRGELVVY